jgi:YidC/Oxa1 family membrane protein insertase
MDFTSMTIEFLKFLATLVGNYGVAIILLTIVVRALLWPLNVSQQRSMRQMQVLSPKLKAIQERYKSDPQKMQQKMMEFYKEHKFNPMGGCFPLLVQMPVFILLYTALISPQFIQVAGDTSFLGIKLDSTLRSSVGISNDGVMGVSKSDMFGAGKTATLYLIDETLENVKINKPNKALEIQGDLVPGEPVDFKISLDNFDLRFSQLDKIQKADITITDVSTREIEKISFVRQDGLLVASVPTTDVKHDFHWDIMVLIALFGATMWLSQKVMMQTSTNTDPTQAAIQKSMSTFMPILIIGTFIIIPIPAGVLLYLVTSNLLQIAQTVIVNKQLTMEETRGK